MYSNKLEKMLHVFFFFQTKFYLKLFTCSGYFAFFSEMCTMVLFTTILLISVENTNVTIAREMLYFHQLINEKIDGDRSAITIVFTILSKYFNFHKHSTVYSKINSK